MPVTRTYGSLVKDALRFYTESAIWLGIGRTTAWTDEANPPTADMTAETLTEPIAYKKVDVRFMVRPMLDAEQTDENTVVWRGRRYMKVNPASALAEKACFVYYSATIAEGEIEPCNYRQVGTFTDLQPAAGSENQNLLLASEVTDPGILEVLENRKMTSHDPDTTELLAYVREF